MRSSFSCLFLTVSLSAGCYGERGGALVERPPDDSRRVPSAESRPGAAAQVFNAKGSTSSDTGHNDEIPPLAVFDYGALRQMERDGYDFASMAFGWRRAHPGLVDNRTLSKNAKYASIVETLGLDLAEARRSDAAAGVGMRFAHRLFDHRWLTNPRARFELVSVVNRVDRRPFVAGSCGELRLIYRLAYGTEHRGAGVSSRLPMTVNVVHVLSGPDCRHWLRQAARVPAQPGSERNDLLRLEPMLVAALEGKLELRSVEVNLQLVRWPSTVRPTLAGHAEYLLRVFRPDAAGPGFIPASLENTPDVVRLSHDAALVGELSSWLRSPEQVNAIANGTVQVPERFLTKAAVSVAPHGLARRSNRPFTALLEPLWRELPGADETLRRLDGLSCPGCHQSRSVAGFHILGQDAPELRADVLMVPHSPHFEDDAGRRGRYVAALLGGEVPAEYRPPAEHPSAAGTWGARCGLNGAAGAAFAAWKCAAGLTCRAVDDALVGECLSEPVEVGDACEPGEITWASAKRDGARLSNVRDCGGRGVCERNAVGFPGGMCSGGCDQPLVERAVCGEIAVLDAFNACIARGEAFTSCLSGASRPGLLRGCSIDAPCRDDYVCAVTSHGEGACIPPYFLFQLRVDGHPL